MRFIIVGTRYTTSTECSSIAASVASASKRGSTTRCAPASSATHDQTTGPLWYSGPGISRHPSGSTPSVGRASASMVRRVAGDDQLRPPGRTARRRRLPRRRGDVGQGRVVDRRVRHVARRQAGRARAAAPGSTPTTTFESASSTIACSSASGSRYDTGCGMAPSFHAAAAVTNQSIEFGSAIVTMSPSPTPRPCRSRASRLAAASNPARVIESSPQVISTRSGSAAARSVNRRA